MKSKKQMDRWWLEFRDTGVYKEGIETIDKSFHTTVYRMAFQKLGDIIERNFEKKEIKTYNNPVNVLAFIGDRGSGKSSVMMSFLDVLKDYAYYKQSGVLPEAAEDFLRDRDVTFTCLDCIDGALLEKGEDIFSLVLAQIYQKLVDMEQANGIYRQDSYEPRKREVFKQLEDLYRISCEIQNMNKSNSLNSSSVSYLSNLDSLASSQKMKREFQTLIENFTQLMIYQRKDHIEYSKTHYLVISVDDIDLNIENGFAMLEKIHRYLMVKNVIVVLAIDYHQMHKLAIQNFYRMYPQVDAVLREGGAYAGKIATEYLDKVLPINYRIYLSDISNRYIDNHTGVLHEKTGLKKAILGKIYRRTGICFDSQGKKRHFYQTSSMRQLNNFYLMLNGMRHTDIPGIYRNIAQKNSEEVCWKYMDENWTYMIQDLMNRIAVDKTSIDPEYLGELIENTEKTTVFSDNNRFLEHLEAMDLRRTKGFIAIFLESLKVQGDLGSGAFVMLENMEEEYSYGSLVESIYSLGRVNNNQYKQLVHCLLAYYSYMFTREYLFGMYGVTYGDSGDPIVPKESMKELIGGRVLEEWGQELLPYAVRAKDENQNIDEEGEVVDPEDAIYFGSRDVLLTRAFGTYLSDLDIRSMEDVALLICDLEVLYLLITGIRDSFHSLEEIEESMNFKVETYTGNRERILLSFQNLGASGGTALKTVGFFSILNFIPNAYEATDRLNKLEEKLLYSLAPCCPEYTKDDADNRQIVIEQLRVCLQKMSLKRAYEEWEEDYGKNALPFPLHWFDMAYNILKRTRRHSKERFPKKILNNELKRLFDYIVQVYQDMGEQLQKQYEYYKMEMTEGYDFAKQFKTCPVFAYFTGDDLAGWESDVEKREVIMEKRRLFWAEYFRRIQIEEDT